MTRAWLLLAVALAGCATLYVRGRAALSDGRYDETAAPFRDVLAADPAPGTRGSAWA